MPHLLVVDEVLGSHGDLGSMLQAAGMRVSTVDCLPEATWCASEQAADLALVIVAVAGGKELLSFDSLRMNLPRVPIVVIATGAQQDLATEAMKRGAFDFLVAPLEVSRLHAVVDRALESAQPSQAATSGATSNGGDTPKSNGIPGGTGGSLDRRVAMGNGASLNHGVLDDKGTLATTEVHHGPGQLALEQLARDLLRAEPGSAYRRLTALVDEAAVQEALNCAKGNQLQAAALLGISRTTLRAKLRAMGLSVAKHVYLNRASD